MRSAGLAGVQEGPALRSPRPSEVRGQAQEFSPNSGPVPELPKGLCGLDPDLPEHPQPELFLAYQQGEVEFLRHAYHESRRRICVSKTQRQGHIPNQSSCIDLGPQAKQ